MGNSLGDLKKEVIGMVGKYISVPIPSFTVMEDFINGKEEEELLKLKEDLIEVTKEIDRLQINGNEIDRYLEGYEGHTIKGGIYDDIVGASQRQLTELFKKYGIEDILK